MLRQIACALIAASLALSTVPNVAFAQDAVSQKVQQLSKEGVDAYRAGKYEEAARKFEAAYELEPVDNLLFNAAKCYEKLEEWDKAIELYEQFAAAPGVDPKAKELALQKVESLNEVVQLEKERTAKSGDETPDPSEKEPARPLPAAEPDYTWAYVSLGTGIALLATGGVFGVLASTEQNNFDVALTPEERREARDSGSTYALIADISYGVGAAAAITGIILFFTTEAEETDPGVAISPVIGPDNVGVGLSGSF